MQQQYMQNTVISALATTGQVESAEAWLEEMYSDYLKGNDSTAEAAQKLLPNPSETMIHTTCDK
jgi:pentatricopeptide repeat protein